MQESKIKLAQYGASLFLVILLLFVQVGCCPPCQQRPILPTEPSPIMTAEVETNDAGGLDEKEFLDILEDLYHYQGSLDKCNDIIIKYNATVLKGGL